jgi:hypothetical protein
MGLCVSKEALGEPEPVEPSEVSPSNSGENACTKCGDVDDAARLCADCKATLKAIRDSTASTGDPACPSALPQEEKIN